MERITKDFKFSTVSADVSLTVNDKIHQVIDPNGAARTVTLPEGKRSSGLWFVISNADTTKSYDLTVNNFAGSLVVTIPPLMQNTFYCDDGTWKYIEGITEISGITDVTIADGGTGASTAKAARQALGLAGIRTATAVSAGAATLTATQIIDSGVFVQTPSANNTLTTGTATDIVAAMTNPIIGSSFEITIVNLAAATYVITLAGGTDVTPSGLVTIAAATSGTWLGVCTAVTGTPAITLYRK